MAASSSSVSRPQVMVPSASRDTTSPLRPSARCSTTGQPTGGSGGTPGSAVDAGAARRTVVGRRLRSFPVFRTAAPAVRLDDARTG